MAVAGADGNSNARFPQLDRPGAVDDRNLLDLPSLMRLGNDLFDLRLDDVVISLVLEMSDPGLSWGVISHGAEKQGDRATAAAGHVVEQLARIDPLRTHGHEIDPFGLFACGHTINSVDNNNPEPWERTPSPPVEPERPGPSPDDSATWPQAVAGEPPSSPPLFPYAELPTEPREQSPRPRWRHWFIGAFAGATLLAGALWVVGAFDGGSTTVDATAAPQVIEIREVVTPADDQTSARAVARKVIPSIVTVDVGLDNNGVFERFGSGSGVVLRADGYIVTNEHVIRGADRVQVIFDNGRIYEAEIVGGDRRTDLAVVRINATGLVPIQLGTTDEAEIGEQAIAVGSPLGLDGGPSLTVGVVSAFGRQVRTGANVEDILFDMLQTDAPILQGSSGGALVDGQGRLLGITSAIGVSAAGPEGIGFAIPTELVTRITDEIIETGGVEHAFLGVTLSNVFNQAADGAQVPAGAVISDFATTASAAQTAGLQPGDVVVGLDDEPVLISDDLISGLRRLRVGDAVTLDVVRDTERLEITVVLGARPDDL